MNIFIPSLRYSLLAVLIFILSACDILTPKTPAHESCRGIALTRLKHPESYRENAQSEIISQGGQTEIRISFDAWNDYKVPMPFSIICIFQAGRGNALSRLLSVKWNGRPLRPHELDDIRLGN